MMNNTSSSFDEKERRGEETNNTNEKNNFATTTSSKAAAETIDGRGKTIQTQTTTTTRKAPFKNPLLEDEIGLPPRSDSPAIDISFAHGFDSHHHHLTSVQEVYTNAAILDAAHQSMNFLDSKDFVDTEIRTSASLTISNFLNIGGRWDDWERERRGEHVGRRGGGGVWERPDYGERERDERGGDEAIFRGAFL